MIPDILYMLLPLALFKPPRPRNLTPEADLVIHNTLIVSLYLVLDIKPYRPAIFYLIHHIVKIIAEHARAHTHRMAV